MHSLSSYSWKAGKSFHLSAAGNCAMKFFVQSNSGIPFILLEGSRSNTHLWICVRWDLTWDLCWCVGTSYKGRLLLTRTHSGLWKDFCSTLREVVDTGMVRRCLCSSLVSGRDRNLLSKLWGWLTQADFFLANNAQCSDSHLSDSVFYFFQFFFQTLPVVNNLNFAGWLFTLFCSALHSLKMHGSFPWDDNKD